MAFPLTHRGKLEFSLRNAPNLIGERFYDDASFKLERSFALDADVEVTVSDKKLIVSYTIRFKKLLTIVSVFVPVGLGIFFSIQDTLIPPDWPHTWGQKGAAAAPPSINQMLFVMGFFWIWLFGMNYLITVVRFRSLLRDTWKELKLS
jgi:hypothetical protein